jgi:hypothetical protein
VGFNFAWITVGFSYDVIPCKSAGDAAFENCSLIICIVTKTYMQSIEIG